MVDLIAGSAFWASAVGFGGLFCRIADAPLDRLERLLLSAALGSGVLALLALGAGALGLYRPIPLVVLLALGLTALPAGLRAPAPPASARRDGGVPHWVVGLAVVSALGLLASAFGAAAPPTNTDSLRYHLAIPQAYLREGALRHLPGILLSNLPQMQAILYGYPLALRGPAACQWIAYGNGWLLLASVYVLARRGGTGAACVAASLTASFSDVPVQMSIAASDLAVAAYQVLATHFFLRRAEGGGRADLVLCAALVGFAASSKITGGIIGVSLLLLGLTGVARGDRARATRVWRDSATFCGGVLLILSPWLLKAWLHTGNPIFPLGAELLGGQGLDPRSAAWREGVSSSYDPGRSWAGLIVSPWSVTMRANPVSGFIGPALLALLPALPLLLRPVPPHLVACAILATIYWPVWYAATPATRFLLGPLALLACAAGACAVARWPSPLARRIALAAVWASVLGGLGASLHHQRHALALAAGAIQAGEYRERRFREVEHFAWDRTYRWIRENLSPHARIAVADDRVLGLERDAIVFVTGLMKPEERDSPEGLRRGLLRLGVTHLAYGPGWPPEIAPAAEALEARGLADEVYRSENQRVWALAQETVR